MSGKKLMFDPQLREALAVGSAAVCGTVASNFGPEGRNTIRDQKYDLPLVANTGRRILQEMSLPDAGEDLAAVLIREAALKVAATCGDGSITTTLLTAELLRAGSRLVAAGYNPMELRSGLQKALPVLRAELDALTVPFETVPAEKFAAACAKNDEVAENSLKAFAAVGAEGVITVEDTQSRDTAVNIWDGVRYEYGLLNTSFMTDSERRRAVLTHPYVLLSNIKINSLAQIRRMLEQTMRASGELLIITNDMTEEVQRALLVNKAAPGFGSPSPKRRASAIRGGAICSRLRRRRVHCCSTKTAATTSPTAGWRSARRSRGPRSTRTRRSCTALSTAPRR